MHCINSPSRGGSPFQELARGSDAAGFALLEPGDIVNSKAALWGELWETTRTRTVLRWWEPLRQAAARQGCDEICGAAGGCAALFRQAGGPRS